MDDAYEGVVHKFLIRIHTGYQPELGVLRETLREMLCDIHGFCINLNGQDCLYQITLYTVYII